MKTIIRHGLLGAALLLCAALHAQNVQFHYDFGRAAYDRLGDRPLWTTTVEMFKPDKWGSTFFLCRFGQKIGRRGIVVVGNQPRTEILGGPSLGSSRI